MIGELPGGARARRGGAGRRIRHPRRTPPRLAAQPRRTRTGWPSRSPCVEELGADTYLYAVPDEPALSEALSQCVVRLEGRPQLQKGEQVHLVIDPAHVHVFDTATGERLSS